MARGNSEISSAVAIAINEAGDAIAKRLQAVFQRAPMVRALGAERAARVLKLAGQGTVALGWIAQEMRDAKSDATLETRGLPFCLWDVVDAIGFHADCTNRAWICVDDDARRRFLGWANAHLDTLEAGVTLAEANEKGGDAEAKRVLEAA